MRISRGEALGMGVISTAMLAAQLIVLPSRFVGPDAANFLRIAQDMGRPDFWSDPGAFDGNYWSIGYSTFVHAIGGSINSEMTEILILQAVMAVGLSLVAYWVAFDLGSRVRLTSMALVAASPAIWWMARNGGYELLLSVLLCTAVAVLWTGGGPMRGPAWWRMGGAAAVSGVLFGLAILVQGKVVLLGLVLGWLALRLGRRSLWWFAGAAVGVLIPLSMRNALVLGNPLPFTSNGPINVWIGNNPDATTGGFMEPPPLPPGQSDYLSAALGFVVSQPEAAVSLLMRRLARLLEPLYVYPEQVELPATRLLLHTWSIALVTVTTFGVLAFLFGRLWLKRDQLPAVGPLAGFCLVMFLLHVPFLAEARFLSPITPIAVPVATATLWTLIHRHRAGRNDDRGPRFVTEAQ